MPMVTGLGSVDSQEESHLSLGLPPEQTHRVRTLNHLHFRGTVYRFRGFSCISLVVQVAPSIGLHPPSPTR